MKNSSFQLINYSTFFNNPTVKRWDVIITQGHISHIFLEQDQFKNSYIITDLNCPYHIESTHNQSLADRDTQSIQLQISKSDLCLTAHEKQNKHYNELVHFKHSLNPKFLNIPFGCTNNVKIPFNQLLSIKFQNPFTFICYGGIWPWYQLEPVLKAFQHHIIQKLPIKLLIVGDGPNFKKYHSIIHKSANIQHVAWTAYSKSHSYLIRSSVGILPPSNSIEDQLSIRVRLFDYLSYANCILGPKQNGMMDLLLDYKCAIALDNALETSEWIQSIQYLFENRHHTLTHQMNALFLSKKLDWKEITKPLIHQLQKIDPKQITRKRLSNHLHIKTDSILLRCSPIYHFYTMTSLLKYNTKPKLIILRQGDLETNQFKSVAPIQYIKHNTLPFRLRKNIMETINNLYVSIAEFKIENCENIIRWAKTNNIKNIYFFTLNCQWIRYSIN